MPDGIADDEGVTEGASKLWSGVVAGLAVVIGISTFLIWAQLTNLQVWADELSQGLGEPYSVSALVGDLGYDKAMAHGHYDEFKGRWVFYGSIALLGLCISLIGRKAAAIAALGAAGISAGLTLLGVLALNQINKLNDETQAELSDPVDGIYDWWPELPAIEFVPQYGVYIVIGGGALALVASLMAYFKRVTADTYHV